MPVRELIQAWYGFLSTGYAAAQGIVGGQTSDPNGTLLTALLLGVLGAASPCQLSTNASSIAYIVRAAGDRRAPVGWSAVAYAVGKILVYSGIGVLAALMGEGLRALAIPTVAITRKAIGPLMILVGLAMLEIWRPRFSVGHGLSARLLSRATSRGASGAFLLGVAFAFAFCPTLAVLFFGYVLPMAVASRTAPFHPAAFALGTMLPLFVTTILLAAGLDGTGIARRLPYWEPRIRRIAGVVFLLAGLNDTLLYWFL